MTGTQSTASGSTSTSLLERVKAQDPDAWRRLVRLYGRMVYYWCQQSNLQPNDLADLFQEVFRAVAAKIASFRRDRPGDSFRGWLRTITKNKLSDHFRRQRAEPPGVGGSDARMRLQELAAEPPGETEDKREGSELYHRALQLIRGEFEERTWQAFWRTAIDEQPTRSVAEELEMSVDAIRQAKSRVLRRLRDEFRDLID